MQPAPLPPELGHIFSTVAAARNGVSPRRLRANDLHAPFRGVRMIAHDEDPSSIYDRSLERELALVRSLSARLVAGQFLSHRSAALLWGAPMPHRADPDLHLSVCFPQSAPQIRGVTGHRYPEHRVRVTELEGTQVMAPASVFTSLASLPLPRLVAIGDYFARVHRSGHGRPNVGRAPLTTITELREMVQLGRWPGAARLRQALSLVREDSWSPRESMTRVELVLRGLPEPELNVDVYDDEGRFIGCLDMAYSRYKVGVEYQGQVHAASFAQDVERIESFRAAGWDIIQVTSALGNRPQVLAERVARALLRRGWSLGR